MFKVGFEVEAFVDEQYDDEFVRKARRFAQVGDDGSIECSESDIPIELRTRPTTPKKAYKILKELFTLIQQYGATNKSCGLHFNFSTKSSRMAKKFNPFTFCSFPIWINLLKKYNRKNNDYCEHAIKHNQPKFLQILDMVDGHFEEHHSSINFEHFQGRPNQRIEIRVFGNKGYEYKYRSIKKECNQILYLFKRSCK